MQWKIHVRKDDQSFQHPAHTFEAALSVACLFLKDGIAVERIEGPDGFETSADMIRPLCSELG
jgi:hypothetical protein